MSMKEDTHKHDFQCTFTKNVCVWCGQVEGEPEKVVSPEINADIFLQD